MKFLTAGRDGELAVAKTAASGGPGAEFGVPHLDKFGHIPESMLSGVVKADGGIPPGMNIGGSGKFKLHPNENAAEDPEPGSVRIAAHMVDIPQVGRVKIDQTVLETPLKTGLMEGVCWVVIGSALASARFSGWASATDGMIFAARYDWDAEQWSAVDATGQLFPFDPADDDDLAGKLVRKRDSAGDGIDKAHSYISHDDKDAPDIPTDLVLSQASRPDGDGGIECVIFGDWSAIDTTLPQNVDFLEYQAEFTRTDAAGDTDVSDVHKMASNHWSWVVKSKDVCTVRLRSWDLLGNKSEWSDPVTITANKKITTLLPPGVNVGAKGPLGLNPNLNGAGAAANGVVQLDGNRVSVPGRKKVKLTQVQVDTDLKTGGLLGVYYILLGDTAAATRFTGFSAPTAGPVFAAGYEWVSDQWTAYDATGAAFPFTPAANDALLARIVRKSSGSAGIEKLHSFTTDTRADTLPAPTGLAVVQQLKKQPDGTTSLKLVVTCDASSATDLGRYGFEITHTPAGGSAEDPEVEAKKTPRASASAIVGDLYSIRAALVDEDGVFGTYSSAVTITPVGDATDPGVITVSLAPSARPKGVMMKATAPNSKFVGGLAFYVKVNGGAESLLTIKTCRKNQLVDFEDKAAYAIGDSLAYTCSSVNGDGVISATRTSMGSAVVWTFIKPGDLDTARPNTPATPILSMASRIGADGTYHGRMKATWTANSDAVIGYSLEISDGTNVTNKRCPTNNTFFDVVDGLTYTATLTALNQLNVPSLAGSSASLLAAADTTAPGNISGGSATAIKKGVKLAWTDPTDIDLARVEISRNTTNNSATAVVVNPNGRHGKWIDHEPLDPTQTYWYWGQTFDETGNTNGTRTAIGNTHPTGLVVADVVDAGLLAPLDPSDLFDVRTDNVTSPTTVTLTYGTDKPSYNAKITGSGTLAVTLAGGTQGDAFYISNHENSTVNMTVMTPTSITLRPGQEGVFVKAISGVWSLRMVRILCDTTTGLIPSARVNATPAGNTTTTTNASNTSFTLGVDGPTIIHDGPISASRNINFSWTSDFQPGMRARLIRTANSTGAFNLNVQYSPPGGGSNVLVKALAGPSTWCDVEVNHAGTQLFVCASGSL